jgi:hypothetical protein
MALGSRVRAMLVEMVWKFNALHITTTEIYLHVAMGANGLGVVSPLDTLEVACGRFAFVA